MFSTFNKKYLPISLLLLSSFLSGCGSSSDDDNSAPVITGPLNPTVAENTVEVGSYSASDVDGDSITFSLSGDAGALFSISQSGQLSFLEAPDYESNETGPFDVTIIATDDSSAMLSAELSVQVLVGDENDTPALALVQTVAPDYSVFEVAKLDAQSQQVVGGYYIKNGGDYILNSYQSDIFHIGRFGIDTIEKYNAIDLDSQVWSYTTQDDQDSSSRNPYAIVSASETKAYLIRYGSDKVWVVNPQAEQAEDFKIGELDLAGYVATNNSSNTPNPSAAAISDGKLFIAMQRMSDAFSPNTAYVAVFDVSTDEEIETNANTDDNVKGIPLLGLNPLINSVTSFENNVYITTRSSYSGVDLSFSQIEVIDNSDYSLDTVLSAQDIEGNTAGFINTSVIVSASQGYFVANETFFSPSYFELSTVYQFNPSTGDILEANVAETGTEQISTIALDSADFLWLSVSNPTLPGVDIVDTDNNMKVIPRLATELNPGSIVFIEE
jgi:hypothetical protein